MPDTEANPESIDPDTLRSVKDAVQARIDRISNHPGTTSDKATSAIRMRDWFDVLKSIDRTLIEFENAA